MRIDRRLAANFDWVVFGSVLTLSLAGIMTIYSATRPLPGGEQPSFYIKQTYWLAIGVFAMLGAFSLDYSWLFRHANALFGGGLALLVTVLVAGKIGMGAQRWIYIGPVGFQPSEFFKLTLIIALARCFSQVRGNLGVAGILFAFGVYALPSFLLLLKQPDLGTGAVLVFLFVLLALAKGVRKKIVVLSVLIVLVSSPFFGTIAWDRLKDYQKERILAFMHPEKDPGGIGYHINQSKVAVGSGKVLGKGYLKGTQGPFRFLPEKHTDFIFSVFAEEWGFMGSIFLMLGYLMLILRGIHIAYLAKDEFGRLLAFGITFMFTVYWFINTAMTLGLMPVVGLPLPFMSYGGTALVSNFIAAGVLMSIRARRYELFY